MRVVVHAGFHKTGTTSIQHGLRRNGRKMARICRVLTRVQIEAVCEAARAASITDDPSAMALFTYELAQMAEALDPSDPRPVLISAEDLSGHMPGRFELTGYGAAPRLMACIEAVLQEVRPGAALSFFFTTRAAAPWVRSCHAQHVRAIRFTEDRASYVARMLPHADLGAEVARVAAAVAAPVHSVALEDWTAHRLGPLAALLDVLDAPQRLRDSLTAVGPANPSFPDAVLERMLALNRSDLPRAEWVAAKKALMEEWRAGQGRPSTP